MNPTEMPKSSRMPRILNVMLLCVTVLLGLVVLFMLGLAIVLFLPSGLREQIVAGMPNQAPDMTSTKLALACLGGAIMAFAYLFVVLQLRKIVGTLLQGDPFVPDNISRLRVIWIVIAAAEVFRMVVTSAAAVALSSTSVGPAESTIDIRAGTWFLVFVIASLAEVFRHGAELRRDQELTI